jgi:hypothetical protein
MLTNCTGGLIKDVPYMSKLIVFVGPCVHNKMNELFLMNYEGKDELDEI